MEFVTKKLQKHLKNVENKELDTSHMNVTDNKCI